MCLFQSRSVREAAAGTWREMGCPQEAEVDESQGTWSRSSVGMDFGAVILVTVPVIDSSVLSEGLLCASPFPKG